MHKPTALYDYEHHLEPELLEFLMRIDETESEGRKLDSFYTMKE